MASQSVKREDFVNPHAYYMRTDYYVVSPNSRACIHVARVLVAKVCARRPDP